MIKILINEIKKITREYDEKRDQFERHLDSFLADYIPFMKSLDTRGLSTQYTDWGIQNDDIINIRWEEETWQYGGHDSGRYSFPLKYMYDKEEYDNFKKQTLEDVNKKNELRKQESLKKKWEILENLKKELGDK